MNRIWQPLAAAIILAFQLLVPPPIGLASNGDFGKMLGIFDLAAPAEDENRYADIHYTFDPTHHYETGVYSTETLLIPLAIALNSVVAKPGAFDLRWIGVVHGTLFLAALLLLQPVLALISKGRRIAVSLAILFVFCDVMYASILNSFYMDAAAFLFLLLMAVMYLRASLWRRKTDAIWFVVFAILMIASKTQHAVLGFWLAALTAWSGVRLHGRTFATVSTLAVLAATLACLRSISPEYPVRGVFSAIFYQVLPNTRDPTAALHDLGLDESYRRYIGKHAYSEGVDLEAPALHTDFSSKTSYRRLAWYFLTHPRDAYLALDVSLAQAGRQRPFLGNYDRNANFPPGAESHAFSFWSDIKASLFYEHGTRYLIAWVALAVAACLLSRNAGALMLAALALTAMLVAALADAVDVPRHHFLSNALFDMLAVTALNSGIVELPLANRMLVPLRYWIGRSIS